MDDRFPDISSLTDGDSALLLAPDESRCRRTLLGALGDVDTGTGVLLVATNDANDSVAELRRRSVPSEAIGVVNASTDGSLPSGVAEADAVAGPGSLSALGIATSDLLERLSHRFDRVVVGVDSTTALLTATTLPATFRFLHVLGGRVRASDAVLIATIDRSAHEEETRRTITQLFGETVTVD